MCPISSNKRFKSKKNLTLFLCQFPKCKPFRVLHVENVSTSSGSIAGEFLPPMETSHRGMHQQVVPKHTGM
jgi:hypothetical protein